VNPATSVALAGVFFAGASLAVPPTPTHVLDTQADQAAKPASVTGPHDPRPQSGGENIATAVVIPALPYGDSGNTCGFLNDYDAVCPFTGSTSPDVVYRYAPSTDTQIEIDLCASSYDTKVFVYENSAGNEVACNDDACGDTGFQSSLTMVPVTAGNVYYIVIDGYGNECGSYDLVVSDVCCCQITCPAGAVVEGEPDCYDGYDDHTNGGCNSTPNVFLPVPCSSDGTTVELCGRYGGFQYGPYDYRDTDWYVVDGTINTSGFTWCLVGESPVIMGYITVQPCAQVSAFDDVLSLSYCEEGCLEVPPGDYWLWVGTSNFGPDVGCSTDYLWTTDGYDCGPVAVQPASWGRIKGGYR
jgi:hypothetical protein